MRDPRNCCATWNDVDGDAPRLSRPHCPWPELSRVTREFKWAHTAHQKVTCVSSAAMKEELRSRRNVPPVAPLVQARVSLFLLRGETDKLLETIINRFARVARLGWDLIRADWFVRLQGARSRPVSISFDKLLPLLQLGGRMEGLVVVGGAGSRLCRLNIDSRPVAVAVSYGQQLMLRSAGSARLGHVPGPGSSCCCCCRPSRPQQSWRPSRQCPHWYRLICVSRPNQRPHNWARHFSFSSNSLLLLLLLLFLLARLAFGPDRRK